LDGQYATYPKDPATYSAADIGVSAHRYLQSSQNCTILGQTSRGIFIRLGTDGIVFVTVETFRGPLTMNIRDGDAWLETKYQGRSCDLQAGGIVLPDSRAILKYDQAKVWQPSPPPPIDSPPHWRERIKAIVERLGDRVSSSPFSGYLVRLTGADVVTQTPDPVRLDGLEQVRRGLRSNDIHLTLGGIRSILGFGPGLTPSGDDVISGMMLGISRYPLAAQTGLRAGDLIDWIQPLAAQATTLLSRNIIANAARGMADERLVGSLDAVLSGDPDIDTAARYLAMWGSSSGVDSLVGMSLAIWGE
jgi:hypothetical protein